MLSTAGELLGVKNHNDSVALEVDADKFDKTEYSDDNDDFSGKSRSSTITLAFLIQKTSLTLEDAIVQVVVIIINFFIIVIIALIDMIHHYRRHNISLSTVIQVKSARTINPNLGFLTALIRLEESLASQKN